MGFIPIRRYKKMNNLLAMIVSASILVYGVHPFRNGSSRQPGAQARLTDDRITAEVRDACNAVEAAQERLKWVMSERAIALDLEARERERFKLGDGTMFMVNLREQTSFEARVKEVDAQLDLARAIAALRAATGWAE